MNAAVKAKDLVSPLEIPGMEKLVTFLRDPTYAPTGREDLNSRRFDMLYPKFEVWYAKVIPEQSETVVRAMAKLKAAEVIYGSTYGENATEFLKILDEGVAKLLK